MCLEANNTIPIKSGSEVDRSRLDSVSQAIARGATTVDGLRRATAYRQAVSKQIKQLATLSREMANPNLAKTLRDMDRVLKSQLEIALLGANKGAAKAAADMASQLATFTKATHGLLTMDTRRVLADSLTVPQHRPATTTVTCIESADGYLHSQVPSVELAKAVLEFESAPFGLDRCELILTLSNKTEASIEWVHGVVRLFRHGRKVCTEAHEFEIHVANGLEPGERGDVKQYLGSYSPPFEKSEGYVKAVLVSAIDHKGDVLPPPKQIGFSHIGG